MKKAVSRFFLLPFFPSAVRLGWSFVYSFFFSAVIQAPALYVLSNYLLVLLSLYSYYQIIHKTNLIGQQMDFDIQNSPFGGAAGSVPDDEPRSAPRSGESKGREMTIAVWLLVSVSGAFLTLRIYCKRLMKRGRWWDDHVLVAAWVSDTHEVNSTTTRDQ